jgi:hypothetical protein
VMHHHQTSEAREIREQRRAARRHQPVDLLAERVRPIAYWKRANAEHAAQWGTRENARYVAPIYGHPGFRRLVLPGVRAFLNARERAWKEHRAAELRADVERMRQMKAERLAAAARAAEPQTELF